MVAWWRLVVVMVVVVVMVAVVVVVMVVVVVAVGGGVVVEKAVDVLVAIATRDRSVTRRGRLQISGSVAAHLYTAALP